MKRLLYILPVLLGSLFFQWGFALPTRPETGTASSTVPSNRRDLSTSGLILLLTDFGTKGYLLGSLKGSIYQRFPDARIDSLTHEIAKFDVDEAAQTLALCTADFPRGTVFVVVVDPGMSRPRTPIAVETENGHFYVAPNNGVLTQIAIRYGVKRAVIIDNPNIVRVSSQESTFLSRDIFGPAAAELARGTDITELGPKLTDLYLLTSSPATIVDNRARGTVSLIDGFGNVHTNIRAEQLQLVGLHLGDPIAVRSQKQLWKAKWVRTYGDVAPGEALALVGAHDEVQLALNQGNLAISRAIEKGAEIEIGAR